MTLNQFQKARRGLLALLLLLALPAMALVASQGLYEVHERIEAAGFALIAIGILGRMWCTLYIGGRKSARIVASGPYSLSRNPLYVFSCIAAAGAGAQTGSLVLALLGMMVCFVAFYIVARREERHLAEKFGPAFDRYRERVPRFLPKLRLYSDDTEVTVEPRLIYRTLADGLVFYSAYPVLETIEHFQNTGLLPVLLHLP